MLRPLKTFAVLLHEFSHAVFVCVSCGEVKSINVNQFEGGNVVWFPRCRQFSIPLVSSAGYIGSSVFAAFLLLSIADLTVKKIAFLTLTILFFLSSFLALRKGRVLRFDGVFIMCMGGLTFLCYIRPSSWISWNALLLISAIIGMYSIFDVYDDTVKRVLRFSDASVFAKSVFGNYSKSKLVGYVWLGVCISNMLLSTLFLIVILSSEPGKGRPHGRFYVPAIIFAVLSFVYKSIEHCRR